MRFERTETGDLAFVGSNDTIIEYRDPAIWIDLADGVFLGCGERPYIESKATTYRRVCAETGIDADIAVVTVGQLPVDLLNEFMNTAGAAARWYRSQFAH